MKRRLGISLRKPLWERRILPGFSVSLLESKGRSLVKAMIILKGKWYIRKFWSVCYYNKIPQTMWLINNRDLFLIILESGKSKLKVPAWLFSGEDPLPGS